MAFSKSKRAKNTHPSAKYRSKGESRNIRSTPPLARTDPQRRAKVALADNRRRYG
jgi:hypothetical protein